MLKALFSTTISLKLSIANSPKVLRILNIPMMFASSRNLFMGSSKHLKLDSLASPPLSPPSVLLLLNLILPYLFFICLPMLPTFFFMLMT
jgi:hypothetical protein